MMTRAQARKQSALYLNSLLPEELFGRFGITRIGDVTGLDRIGIPVLTAARPRALIVSVNAGKSMERSLARAGAIAEAIEFSTFEVPGTNFRGTTPDLGFPLAEGSTWNTETPIALEEVTHLGCGSPVPFPSSLVWITRPKDEPVYFQKSSNGQATGADLEDALCQGLLECVERDQYVLSRCTLAYLKEWPPRCAFSHPAVEAVEGAGLKTFLFYCSLDLDIPVYWAIILDPAWRHAGGWGAHLNPAIAAERAVLEAIQSRAVVISGARDDLDRRDPDWQASVAALKELEALPITHQVREQTLELSATQELELLLSRLGYWKERIYYKHIDLGEIHVVKVQVLGFEQPVMRHWKELRWSRLREQYLSVQASLESMLKYFQVKSS